MSHHPARRYAAGLYLPVLAALACGGDRSRFEESTLTILTGGDEWALGPQADNYPQHLVFLTLVQLDERREPQPRLAESWEHSPDYRTWTIRLRRDVRWHDGVPVTAHDVLFSMQLFTHPDIQYWRAGPIESFALHDDFTVTVTFSKPTLEPVDGWSSIYPKHLLEQLDPGEYHSWEFWTRPIGAGPYRYVRHTPETMMEFEANPDYFLGRPLIERVVIKFGGGANPVIELLSGNVDAVWGFSEADVQKVVGDPRYRVYREMNDSYARALLWNHAHPLFRDPSVRRALAMAIDRREVHQVLNLPEDTPIFDGIFTGRQFWRGEFGPALPYDPERAKQLLAAAGWRDTDGDGIRELNGEDAAFTLLAAVASGGVFRTYERVGISLQEQLRDVGIRVEVKPLESGLVGRRLRNGEFDAAMRIFSTYPAAILGAGVFGDASRIGYQNPELVRLLETADGTADPESRDSLYREMQEIFHADLPVLFLYPHGWSSVVHRRVRGLERPLRVNPFTYMEHLWLEDARE